MTITTTNMLLVLPDVGSTVGPTWASLLNAAYNLIDSHDHSTGKGVAITPSGLNISSDLTFASNNATNLRSARFYNNSSISLGVNDKTCLYSLNDNLYYVDGAGNNIQVTTGGALNISGTSALTINDSAFILQYFGDTSRKARFSAASIPSSTTRTLTLPESGADDTLVSNNSTSILKNKTLSDTTTTIGEVSDNTKALKFSLSSATTAKTLTIASAHTNNRTVTMPDATGTIVLKDSADDLSNKSFITTTTIKSQNLLTFNNSANTFATSLRAGSNTSNVTFSLPITDGSASQVLKTDGSGQLGWTTAATTTGNVAANDSNVTFTNADNRHQSCLPTTARTYTMPTTSISAGDSWDFDNQSLFLITVNSSGGNLIGYVYPKSSTRFVALISTPTTAAHWNTIYESIVPALVAANDSATSFTFLDNQFQVSNPTAARTYTLPTTGVPAGYIFEVYNQATSSANYIIIQSSGSNTVTILPPLGYVKLQAAVSSPTTAANWIVLKRQSQWVSYTPTYTGLGTVTNVSTYYKLSGDSIHIKGFGTTGTTTATLLSATLPSGFSVSTTKTRANATGASGFLIGTHAAQASSDTSGCIVSATTTSTSVIYWGGAFNGLNALTAQNGSSIYASSKDFSWYVEVPVA